MSTWEMSMMRPPWDCKVSHRTLLWTAGTHLRSSGVSDVRHGGGGTIGYSRLFCPRKWGQVYNSITNEWYGLLGCLVVLEFRTASMTTHGTNYFGIGQWLTSSNVSSQDPFVGFGGMLPCGSPMSLWFKLLIFPFWWNLPGEIRRLVSVFLFHIAI